MIDDDAFDGIRLHAYDPDTTEAIIALRTDEALVTGPFSIADRTGLMHSNVYSYRWTLNENPLAGLEVSPYLRFVNFTTEHISGEEFIGLVWWPYLEMGVMGGSRMLHGFDLVGEGEVTVSLGYDQGRPELAAGFITLDAETMNGGVVPMPMAGPSFQMRLEFSGNQRWRIDSAVLYLQDFRVMA